MEPKDDVFNGTRDRYKGVTVKTASEKFDLTKFPIRLQSRFQLVAYTATRTAIFIEICFDFLESLDYWKERQCRTVWFKVDVGNSDVVPILAKV